MDIAFDIKERITNEGFAIINNVFTEEEVDSLLTTISGVNTSNPSFRKTNDLFAIRQFLKEVPASINKIFNDRFNKIISDLFGTKYFIVKSIYFDKPENSNWFVSYHQDLTISVDKKLGTGKLWSVDYKTKPICSSTAVKYFTR